MVKDHVNHRGRWHSSAAQVDTYIAIDRPYPDALIASCLCGPEGPIRYKVNSELIPPEFILQVVAPGCVQRFGPKIAMTLGAALLWAAVTTSNRHRGFILLPKSIKRRIRVGVGRILGCDPDVEFQETVVKRIEVVCSGEGAALHVLDVADSDISSSRSDGCYIIL